MKCLWTCIYGDTTTTERVSQSDYSSMWRDASELEMRSSGVAVVTSNMSKVYLHNTVFVLQVRAVTYNIS